MTPDCEKVGLNWWVPTPLERSCRCFSSTNAKVCPVKAVVVVVTVMYHVIVAKGFTLPPSSAEHFSGLCLFLWPSPSTRLCLALFLLDF